VSEPLFPLRESTPTIRGRKIRVRELTQQERDSIAKHAKEADFSPISSFASLGCVDPKFSIDEAKAMPADVVGSIAKEVMKLSGLSSDEEGTGEPKNA
jgi:hypothetical protein